MIEIAEPDGSLDAENGRGAVAARFSNGASDLDQRRGTPVVLQNKKMTINAKDIKILWAKAAGRCSLQGCRKILVAEASDSVPSKNILIGENCHIVGEKETSPRGKSILTEDERNRYPNLILLCRNHHKIIDDDENEWPVERLHQIKSDHEIWVETALTEEKDTDEEWYGYCLGSDQDNLLKSGQLTLKMTI